MKSFLCIAIIWASALVFHQCHAADLFVSNSGDDGWPGSKDRPFRSLFRAAQIAKDGDAVRVLPGVYLEDLVLNVGGVAWSGPGARLRSVDIRADRITWESFEHAGPLPPYGAAIGIRGRVADVVIRDCYVHDLFNTYGISCFNVSKGRTADDGPQRLVIEGCRLDRVGYINVQLFGRGARVTGNTIANSFGEGDAFRPFGAGHIIKGNTLINVGGGAPAGFVSGGHPDLFQVFGDNGFESYDITIEGNVAIGGKCQISQIEQKGVENIRDWTVQNNVFVDMAMGGSNSMPGIWYRHNTFIRCNRIGGHAFVFAPPGYIRGASLRSGVVNNAFIECGSNPTNNTFGWFAWPDKLDDLTVEGNFVCGPNGAPKRTGTGVRTWRWQPAYGVNGGDPKIDGDGRPGAESPLLKSALAKWATTKDITGASRSNPPTIGAFEPRQ